MDTFRDGMLYDGWLASACMPASLAVSLMERCGGDTECFYSAFMKDDPMITEAIPERFRRLLRINGEDDKLKKMKHAMDRNSICTLRISDRRYPEPLRNIDDPPAILFYQGELSCIGKRIVAVVGSRAASAAGQKASEKISRELSRHGISIISGLACGIDASAHSGCIDGGSPTIAVTGCGLDRVYPAANRPLHDRILETGGLLLSEYSPGESPAGWHFPVRNRIITGLARALVLMEAKIRSGSMTSVQHALGQGKDVFVYPGDPQSEYYEGNHQLLREGGIYFTSAEDIMRDLDWLDNPLSVGQNSGCSSTTELTPDQMSVIKTLQQGVMSFEQLLEHTGMEPAVMMSTLTLLQIKGIITALPGKQYQLIQ